MGSIIFLIIEKLTAIHYGIFTMLIGIFLTLGATLLISSGFTARKLGLETVDYKVFIFFSVFLGVCITGLLLWLFGQGIFDLPLRATTPFIITGIFGGGLLGRIAGIKAIEQIGASRTHALVSASPLITVLIGFTLLGEDVSLQLGIGVAVVVIGASVLSLQFYKLQSVSKQVRESHPLFGLGCAFYLTIISGIIPVLRKLGLELGATPLQGIFIRFTTGMLFYLIYIGVSRSTFKLKLGHGGGYFLFAAFSGVFSPILGMYALLFIPTIVYAAIAKIGPLFTVLFAYIFLKGIEKISWKTVLCAIFIAIGALLVSTA